MKMVNSVCIDAEIAKVWEALTEIEKVSLWAAPVLEASCSGDLTRGIGAERVCKLKGNMTLTETWVEWEEESSFTYVARGIPFTSSAKNRWSIKNENGKTLLTSEADIKFKKGLLGFLMSAMMKVAFKKQGPQALASFKYWVENGEPYKGKLSALSLGAASC